MRKTTALLMVLFLNLYTTNAQTNYYVDGVNGNNNNAGTSINTAWKTIQKACNSATPNSIVAIKGGTYNENVVVNVSGTAGNPITIKNYMNEVVMIDGTGTAGNTLLTIRDKSYLNFENIIVQNLTKKDAQGILVECSEKGTVETLLFKKITIKNINWTSDPNAIPGSSDNAQAFIAYGHGVNRANPISGLVIDSCEVLNNILGFSEAISLDGNIDGFSIKNSKVHDNTNIGILAAGNYGQCTVPSLDHARNGIIEKNECYRNVSKYATSGGIYMDGAQGVVVQGNRCYGNGYGIEVGCEENGTTENITVINNLIHHNETTGISVGGYTTNTTGQVLNCTFRNNTLFLNDFLEEGAGELVIMKASNCIFKNNIIYTNNKAVLFNVLTIAPQANNILDHNCWYTPQNNPDAIHITWRDTDYTDFSAYQAGTSQDKQSFYKNPMLVNIAPALPELGIQAGSPCIDTGDPSTAILTGEVDFKGDQRIFNNRIDMGAYEKGNSIVNTNQEVLHPATLNIYPNPAAAYLTIEIHQPFHESDVYVLDTKGQTLISRKINHQKSALDIQQLPGGIYFIKVVTDKTVEIKKIIKQQSR